MISPVIGVDDVFTVTPTISVSPAYTAEDQIGGVNTITNAFKVIARPQFDPKTAQGFQNQQQNGKIVIQSIHLIDKAKVNQTVVCYFFNQQPSMTSVDNGAFDLTDAEMLKCVGWVSLDSGYESSSSNASTTKTNIGLLIKQDPAATTNSIWMVAKIKGAGTFASTTDLVFQIGVYCD
ncbi:MAG TPA: hypothetical protein PKW79_00265 [Rhabdochlamydiaceae bacterium]|nr:hypothetical protein [Rhabdochlamydiaceae bacterium]